MSLPRGFIEDLIYGTRDTPRFTQDSPVLPDVWMRYAEAPGCRHDLLLTPHFNSDAGSVGRNLRAALGKRSKVDGAASHSVAYTETYVAAFLSFDELVRQVLPETSWWQQHILGLGERRRRKLVDPRKRLDLADLQREETRGLLVRLLHDFAGRDGGRPVEARRDRENEAERLPGWVDLLSPDLLWMMRIVGAIAWSRNQKGRDDDPSGQPDEDGSKVPSAEEMVEAIAELVVGIPTPDLRDDGAGEAWLEAHKNIWLVNLNRDVETAVDRSTLAVKADAARQLFDIRCEHLAWAVVDNGLDARHPAFWADPRKDDPKAADPRDDDDFTDWARHSRVVATYDFTRIRSLLDPGQVDPDDPDNLAAAVAERLAAVRALDPARASALEEQLEELKSRLLRGRKLDWDLLSTFLEVPHDERYVPPSGEHGTHVAGILASDWPQEGVVGMCPDIRLYDLRVLGADGANDEFSVLAALQFIDHLNAKKDFYAIHGVNVSLAIRHEVANFACGRTPVCDECERLVSGGVVVVAAAGNEGYLQYLTTARRRVGGEPRRTDGYHTVSITDPGNAEKVITVGATHRFQPHTYGVSYFSSRGPTGDGRIKPDLVAPGEKIHAPVPGSGIGRKDGTSMAAPHVSGAAALLMARHSELVGRPQRVKRVLCETATDLGRERYFQGAGMLDVLRALQSI